MTYCLFTSVLCHLKQFTTDNCRVRVRKNLDLVTFVVDHSLILVRSNLCAKIDRITDVFLTLKNGSNRSAVPQINILSSNRNPFSYFLVIFHSNTFFSLQL